MNNYQTFLAVSVLTMMLTPGMIALAPKVGSHIGKKAQPQPPAIPEQPELEDHLVIVGFGISGKHMAHVARESGIPYTILEMNPETVNRYRDKEPISHGDASQPVVLEHLGVPKARAMAIVISDPAAVRNITLEARKLNPNLYIVARTRFVTEIAPLHRLGANDVVAEEFESSIEVFSHVLSQYLVPRQDIEAFAAHLRLANYRMIRRMSNAVDSLGEVAGRLPDMGVQALRIPVDSPLCGTKLAHSDIRPRWGLTVVAVMRDGEIMAPPRPDYVFQASDIVYLFGKKEKLHAVAPLFSSQAPPAVPDQPPII